MAIRKDTRFCRNLELQDCVIEADAHLHGRSGLLQTFEWRHLPENYVGAGSTFAAAITAYMAHGLPVQSAIRQAQDYTWRALSNARRVGMGKLVPSRIGTKRN